MSRSLARFGCSLLGPARLPTCSGICGSFTKNLRLHNCMCLGGSPGEGAGRNLLESVRMMTLSCAGPPAWPTCEGGLSTASAVTCHHLEFVCSGI